MTLILREAEVRRLLTMPDAVRALETVFGQLATGTASNTPRARIVLPQGRGVLHVLSAAAPEQGYIGYKAYTAFRTGVRFVVMLYSSEDGRLLAQVEADWLGQMRTGAASGVATARLARAEANLVGLVGTGGQARTQLMAVCAVRAVKAARVYGRDAMRREEFCREMQALLGIDVRPVESAEAAAREAEILITATTAREPVVSGEWVAAGAHINAMGSNWADRRELDGAAVRRAALVVVDDVAQARIEAGDLLLAAAEGQFDLARMAPLAEVVAGKRPGRERPDDVTLFKSLGIGLEDVAIAGHVYQLAREQGMGEEIDFLP